MQCQQCKVELQVKELKGDKMIFICPKCGEAKTIDVKDIKPTK